MPNLFDPTQPLPDLRAQQLELQRQQVMADLLRKRAEATQIPQGQMVGGRFVAPSITQMLAHLFSQYQSGQAARKVNSDTAEINKRIVDATKQWEATLPTITPAQPGHPEFAGPRDPTTGSTELDAVASRPAVIPDRGTVLKATLAGMAIPGNEQAASLWNKGMSDEITREDSQAARKENLQSQLDYQKWAESQRLMERAEESRRRSEDTRLSIEQRRQAAREHIEFLRAHDETLKAISHIAHPNNQQKPLPSAQSKAWVDNESSITTAKQALAGVTGNEKYFGTAYALPSAVTSKLSPNSVEARARVFNVGSLKIKDRSGTAVSASEFERLKPFIPNSYDDATTVKKKLKLFIKEYENTQQSILDYASSQNYRSPRTDGSYDYSGANGSEGSEYLPSAESLGLPKGFRVIERVK